MSEAKQENKNELMVQYEIDGQTIKLSPSIVQEYLVGNGTTITMPEFKLFTELCKVRKLNPFLKEAYIIKYSANQPAQIVVGKDAILKRAVLHPKFNGKQHGIIVLTESGETKERVGTFKLPGEKLVGGWAKVYRKDWDHPTYVTVSFEEVAQKKGDGSLNANWSSKGATMVEKVAVVRALRETFVEDLGGMIDENEAWNQNDLAPRKPVMDVIVQEEPVIEKPLSLDDIE